MIVFALSGEVDKEHADRLQELLATEANDRTVLDLRTSRSSIGWPCSFSRCSKTAEYGS